VAHGDLIWIHRPTFPAQELGRLPLLIIKPPPTKINRSGYMNPRRPTDVNHLIVGFLGNDEILLLCSDCGDLWYYYTSRIYAAVERQQDFNRVKLPLPVDLKPDLAESVGMSAWGLSIHQKARKIAVSSNTHQVTIFQPAIVDIGPKGPEASTLPEDLWIAPPAMTSLDDVLRLHEHPRMMNFRLKLPDTRNNIPCISFCNTDDDPDGRFLAVGDINGRTILWDLQTMNFEFWTAHFCNGHSQWHGCRCLESETFSHAIWGLYWLDSRAFLKYGWAPRNPGQEETYDITNQMEDVPLSSTVFTVTNPDSLKYPAPPAGLVAPDDSESDVGNESSDSNSSNDVVPAPPARRRFVWDVNGRGEPPLPRSPFLWISSKQLAFHQPRSQKRGKGSTVVMRHPMKQTITANSEKHFHTSWWTLRVQRMSLHAAIPELGVVVVATPYGRCAVLSLLQGDTKRGQPYYFYRVDWMLPTKEQEEQGDRPGFTLMGLAVSPIQGQLGEPRDATARKWRLMLQYSDFSLLSYELSRQSDAMPDLEIY
jgi:hypothetical protein